MYRSSVYSIYISIKVYLFELQSTTSYALLYNILHNMDTKSHHRAAARENKCASLTEIACSSNLLHSKTHIYCDLKYASGMNTAAYFYAKCLKDLD